MKAPEDEKNEYVSPKAKETVSLSLLFLLVWARQSQGVEGLEHWNSWTGARKLFQLMTKMVYLSTTIKHLPTTICKYEAKT